MKCCVPACPNSLRRVTNVALFSLPRDKTLRKQWLDAMKIDANPEQETTRVCIKHFKADDVFKFPTRTKLKPGRVPTVNTPSLQNVQEENVQTSEWERSEEAAPLPASAKPKKKQISLCTRQHASQFCIERFKRSDKKICYYTGMQSYNILLAMYKFIFKSEKGPAGAVHQKPKKGAWKKLHKLTPLNELFLTLMKLRRGFDYETLADMFNISKSAVGRIFLAWVHLLYNKLASLKIFPHRNVLIEHAPLSFIEMYPNVIGSIDCTEFVIQRPSSLVRQSQCYSQYKSATTLKGLIMINPNGAIIFISALYTGAISDKKILEESGFLKLLKQKLQTGELHCGDIILPDKGFEVKHLLEDIGICLNIPTFCITGMQFQPQDVEETRRIAHERIHVERAISRLKSFKLLAHRIPICLLGSINQIYTVCALLTNFRYPLRK